MLLELSPFQHILVLWSHTGKKNISHKLLPGCATTALTSSYKQVSSYQFPLKPSGCQLKINKNRLNILFSTKTRHIYNNLSFRVNRTSFSHHKLKASFYRGTEKPLDKHELYHKWVELHWMIEKLNCLKWSFHNFNWLIFRTYPMQDSYHLREHKNDCSGLLCIFQSV